MCQNARRISSGVLTLISETIRATVLSQKLAYKSLGEKLIDLHELEKTMRCFDDKKKKNVLLGKISERSRMKHTLIS